MALCQYCIALYTSLILVDGGGQRPPFCELRCYQRTSSTHIYPRAQAEPAPKTAADLDRENFREALRGSGVFTAASGSALALAMAAPNPAFASMVYIVASEENERGICLCIWRMAN